MADRLQDITDSRESAADCEACDQDEPCDHHWLVSQLHHLRGAISDHQDRVHAHQAAARERHADFGGRDDDLHGIHQDLWATVGGRDTPI
ncbi:hypothetical protein [Salsipaludibacter albus]|uniref:hypothetical protein n=1 Tax=Salsipaludibacter albus TaxID=2849650 RepID=UPI001EE3EEF7|nr:hypothetical protein [Salsipaludibacter albus]MBY5162688.1 hypothetical protein [Salsipaludibacter albus]